MFHFVLKTGKLELQTKFSFKDSELDMSQSGDSFENVPATERAKDEEMRDTSEADSESLYIPWDRTCSRRDYQTGSAVAACPTRVRIRWIQRIA